MRDPHVAVLRYRLVAPETVDFQDPPEVRRETNACTLTLRNGEATVEMKQHFDSEDEAREEVDPLLRAWEIWASLQLAIDEIHFKFVGSEITDRNPEPGKQVIALSGIQSALVMGSLTIRQTHRSYPEPPQSFAIDADVETLWFRYSRHKKGQEPLPSMAYFCLTYLEALAGDRHGVANWLNVSKAVLGKLGELVSTKGDEKSARKGKPAVPLTKLEERWVDQVVRALIQRVGEYAFDPRAQRSQLTMADFPALP
jgi:hypothetical protein